MFFDRTIIRMEMVRNNLTIVQLANLMKLSSNALSAKLNGKTDFKVNEIVMLSKIFDIEPNIFFRNMVLKNKTEVL